MKIIIFPIIFGGQTPPVFSEADLMEVVIIRLGGEAQNEKGTRQDLVLYRIETSICRGLTIENNRKDKNLHIKQF